MRQVCLVVFGVVVLACAASAQDRFERQVRAQLDRVGERLAGKGYELTTQIYTGRLKEEETEEVTVRLRAGVRYALVGVCDEDCGDFDLRLFDPSHREVARDVEQDDVPVVEIQPDNTGVYTGRAIMADCREEPCSFGLGLFASNVDQFERQVREQLNRAARRLGKDGYELTHQIYTGSLGHSQDEDVTIDLNRGRRYVVVGVCDEDCKDLDLRLMNRGGREVDHDVELDDYPLVEVQPGRDEKHTVRAIMASCTKAPCRYGFGVFAR